MTTKKILVASGNPTILVWDCRQNRNNVSKTLLKKAEQVGFIETKQNLPSLTMMGNELSINSTLAFASLLDRSGKLFTSSVSASVIYENTKTKTTVVIPLKFQVSKNIVIFEGIGFVLIKNSDFVTKEFLRNLCEKYNLPAFGAIRYSKGYLEPYVFVKETNSLFKETACGSGSIAISLLAGIENVKQPTGQIIKVKIIGPNVFRVTAKVTKVQIYSMINI